ncbi:DUF1176 domain-containing protein [Nitratireductor thuwali]|uniref:DUF1176 domain-containing protein n=1 Tax=Nitratireductor thuwali TaxID=2267699 RepID=A0ABY5MMT6_9HYPH|nr:hypothetical protein NTH_03755 [Nitratireductor thuwali]
MKFAGLVAVATFVLAAQSSARAEPAYIDDRSSPEALIRSLYNAINRQEYARAYAYFATPPAESLDAYAQGYSNTENVDVETGLASEEGAAGSIYYNLPVAIRARNTDGTEKVFAGCYALRLANPLVQTTPFTPLHIEEGKLAPTDEPLEEALPDQCGDSPPPERDALLEAASRQFTSLYGGICDPAGQSEPGAPESYTIRFNYAYDEADAPKREARLFRFFCDRGAYNETHVYFLAGEDNEVLPLRFAMPELDVRYENDDTSAPVEDLRIIGYSASDLLVNSSYDPETLTLTSHAKWRGVGDASSSGTWIFRSGTFQLVKYDVDASYDGEVNPEVLLDFFSGP